jgi:hypothetical protein
VRTFLLLLLAFPALADSAGGLTWKVPSAWKIVEPKPGGVAAYDVGGIRLEVSYRPKTSNFPAVMAEMARDFPDAKQSMSAQRLAANQVVVVQAEKNDDKLFGVIFLNGGRGLLIFEMIGPKKIVEAVRPALKKMLFAVKSDWP